MDKCVYCNAELEDYSEFCTNCGKKVERKSIAEELLKYKSLLDNQTLKIEEYNEIKKGLLNSYKLHGDKIEEIAKFKKILDDNGITEQEFSMLKQRILSISISDENTQIEEETQNDIQKIENTKENNITEHESNIEKNEKEVTETTSQKINKTVLEILRGIMIAISGFLAFGSLVLGFYISMIVWLMVIAIFTSKVKNKLIDRNEKFKDSIITFRIILPILAIILMFMEK